MHDTFASALRQPLWAAVMQELLQRRDPPLDLPVGRTKSWLRREIGRGETGLLPSRFSPAKLSELFLAGTEPRDYSSDYFAADGKLLCPTRTSRWCASRDIPSARMSRADFRIISPPPNARYQIDPVLPSSQQMVELFRGSRRRWCVVR